MALPVLYLMVGIPGSGKSMAAERLARKEGAILVSTDRLREQLTGNASDRSMDGAVFGLAFRTIRKALDEDRNVVYDATNLTRRDRKRVLKELPSGVRRVCVYLKTPSSVARERNLGRARVVPEEGSATHHKGPGLHRITATTPCLDVYLDTPVRSIYNNLSQSNSIS